VHDEKNVIEPRPAATVVVARDGGDGPEVLLLKRTESAVFMPGAFVFPGGAVDADDSDPGLAARAEGLDEGWLNHIMELREGARAYVMAAIRECFEEAGLLLADFVGRPGVNVAPWRRKLIEDRVTFPQVCDELDLRLHADRIVYLSRWITPPGPPRRFDTRFFLAPAPPGQTANHDGVETVHHVWIHPREALERNRRGAFPLGSPTTRTLRTLAAFETTEHLLEQTRRRPVQPAIAGDASRIAIPAHGRDGVRPVHPEEPAYAELKKLHEESLGQGSYEIVPGVPRLLSPRVTRLTAANPGMMTGPGTNTYLIDCGDGLAVIDPGPELDAHLDAILKTAPGPIRWILATHTHRDHSPGTGALKRRTGAAVLGMPAPEGDSQDRLFAPDEVPCHGERLRLGDVTLRVIHTPGHASNHLCYLLESERLLFSGDHIMQGSTVVINPPDGNMRHYLHSLDMLHGEDLAWIAPGHGFLLSEPDAVIRRIVDHRIARESKVLRALQKLGEGSEDELLPAVYDDVPAALHGVARRSLLAHLIKLCDDGVIQRQSSVYIFKS
jgi:glyoxylase-like metal-dependent hydrolase (beta-lactamase superfamily II)/8-oxo-dGTP pyrophosphatase MutT (NUDIX family)